MANLLEDPKVAKLVERAEKRARKEVSTNAITAVKSHVSTAESRELKASLRAVLSDVKAACA
jgi:enoyl-CoA hydratase/carnithine racemase